MGIYLGPFRFTKRGVRVRIGPRAARLHVGAGGAGVSTGLGPFTAYKSVGRKKGSHRTTTAAHRVASGRAAKVAATETEKVIARQAIQHAFERADRDGFDLAIARYRDLARTKAGVGDLTVEDMKVLPADENRALKEYTRAIQDCIGHPEKTAAAQAAAAQYNLIADRANRRIDMLVSLGTPGYADKDHLPHIEVS